MTFDEAMETLSMASVEETKQELERHGFRSYVENNYIYAEDISGEEQMVCPIYNGECYTREVLEWLGY